MSFLSSLFDFNASHRILIPCFFCSNASSTYRPGFPNGLAELSYPHSAPSREWSEISKGQQYFQDQSFQSDCLVEYPSRTSPVSLVPLPKGGNQNQDTQACFQGLSNQWTSKTSSTHMGGQEPEQDSQRSSNPRKATIPDVHEPLESVELVHSSSQMSYTLSSSHSDVTDTDTSLSLNDAALYPSNQQFMDSQLYSEYYKDDADSTQGYPYSRRSTNDFTHIPGNMLPLSTDSFSLFPNSGDELLFSPNSMDLISPTMMTSKYVQSQDLSAMEPLEDPNPIFLWNGSESHVSRVSSPDEIVGDSWSACNSAGLIHEVNPDFMSSHEPSRSAYTHLLECIFNLPPYLTRIRISQRPISPGEPSRIYNISARTSTLDDGSLPGQGPASRTTDIDNTARDHPLYQKAAPRGDGLYHCPWEGDASCTHKPEKLKCNYEYDSYPYYYIPS